MAKYQSALTGAQMDSALSTMNQVALVSGVIQSDGDGTFSEKAVDTTPTASSTNLITSGGVASGTLASADPTGTGSLSLNRRASTTVGTDSVAVGYNCSAEGEYAHGEGYNCTASGLSAHAEGYGTTALAQGSHAEGVNAVVTSASASAAHVEGSGTTASGISSHAEGLKTVAASNYQHTQGKYNISDSASKYADIIGNGTNDSNRSNAQTTDWSGNLWTATDVMCGGTDMDTPTHKLSGKVTQDSYSSALTVGRDTDGFYVSY